MSNPLTALRRILVPSSATRGVVVEVIGGVARVATPKGLVELDGAGLAAGQAITIDSNNRAIPAVSAAEYWV